jgi:exodeoxyribonuclease VIII
MPPDLTLIPSLSNEAYHQLPAVSPSGLKLLARSPLHYYDERLAPDREIKEPSDAMRVGAALHLAVLEPDAYADHIAVAPVCDRRTSKGKEAYAAFLEESADKLVITRDDADRIACMAEAVRSHPAASFLLKIPGKVEQSYQWSERGVACKCRPDWHADDRSIVVDVKTTQNASRREFQRSISNFDYHVQAAWNRRALGADQFLIVAVESVRPYAVAVYPTSGSMLAAGERRIEAALNLLAQCQQSGQWPGYGDLIADPIDLPAWCND